MNCAMLKKRPKLRDFFGRFLFLLSGEIYVEEVSVKVENKHLLQLEVASDKLQNTCSEAILEI